jgi:hypothetical protein
VQQEKMAVARERPSKRRVKTECRVIKGSSTAEVNWEYMISMRTLLTESFTHDYGRTLRRSEYDDPKESPNTNSYRINPYLQLSMQCSPQHTPKRPSSEPHGATRQ